MDSGGFQGTCSLRPWALVPEAKEKSHPEMEPSFWGDIEVRGVRTGCPCLIRCFSFRLGLHDLSDQMISHLGARVPATEKHPGQPEDTKSFRPQSSLRRLCRYAFGSIHHDRFRFGLSVLMNSQH